MCHDKRFFSFSFRCFGVVFITVSLCSPLLSAHNSDFTLNSSPASVSVKSRWCGRQFEQLSFERLSFYDWNPKVYLCLWALKMLTSFNNVFVHLVPVNMLFWQMIWNDFEILACIISQHYFIPAKTWQVCIFSRFIWMTFAATWASVADDREMNSFPNY